MSFFSGKKIILGITGGIAAYKTAALVRLLIKAGAEVQVIMSPASLHFITPYTLSTLSKRPVYTQFFNSVEEGGTWNNHVDLALWADLMIIAPATANTLGKMVNGLCDNLLMAVYLSAKCPVFVAPAMDLDMYVHPSTARNLATLAEYGNFIIPATFGELASGLVGQGRMCEPEDILEFIISHFSVKDMVGITVLVTAGPTYEAIDPVRFIGNHSSGKMGYDIAKAFASRGAKVILVSGKSAEVVNDDNITLVPVLSADQMYAACHHVYDQVDIVVAAAAVADYKPKYVHNQKIKKNDSNLTIELEKNVDILSSLGQIKKRQFLVGFALETENEIENAKRKVVRKNLDLIVLNSLNDKGAGFGEKTNKITFIDKEFVIEELTLKSKEEVAMDIVDKILFLRNV